MTSLEQLRDKWLARWPEALALWSGFTRLREPRWCLTRSEEEGERLFESFAMIRLDEHAIVVSIRQIEELGIDGFPLEILAHEIGHHILCPADLTDAGRLIARIRPALTPREREAPLVSNLYTDLLINDRLERSAGLRMDSVFRKLCKEDGGKLWTFYMRIYEFLWKLDPGTLAKGKLTPELDVDASIAARLVRSYAKEWLEGAARFAMLCFPYLEDEAGTKVRVVLRGWLDHANAPVGLIPDGLAELDAGELELPINPRYDPSLGGMEPADSDEAPQSGGKTKTGDVQPRQRYRGPSNYRDILNGLGVKVPEAEMTIRYYRERAVPHLVRFPVRQIEQSTDPLPEGLETWSIGDSLEELDIVESLMLSNNLIPGLTTVRRTWGTSPGTSPEKHAVDLYLGIDCSGSMGNPADFDSYPVLAGTIIAISALRAGARVMVCLSGEPGSYSATDGFLRDEHEILKVLTGYLGTGYSFGIHRLKETFENRKPDDRPVHIMIVTDHDIFAMLQEENRKTTGWERAKQSLDAAGGGGTYVLHMAEKWAKTETAKMRSDGWDVAFVLEWEDIVAFAREFSRKKYETPR